MNSQSNTTFNNRVAIFGAGNAGLTAAFHISERGCDVCLYGAPGFDQQIDAISKAGGIKSVSSFYDAQLDFSGFEPIALLSKDIKQAVEYAKTLILPVPSFAQEELFKQMLPYLKSGQTIVLMPGNYGSLVLNNLKNTLGYNSLELNFVDAISIPWATRIVGDAQIAILGLKSQLPLAALPASQTQALINQLQPMFPLPLTPLENVIVAGLENINFGGHPLMTTLNIGLLENFPDQYNYYRDCCSPSTAKACAKLDQERLSVGKALGFTLRTELAAMNALYDMNAASVYDLNRTSQTHGNVNSAPNSSNSRYITEDAPYLLVPCFEFAKLCNIDTPIVESTLHLAGAFNEMDYFSTGRSLSDMGLKDLTLAQIFDVVS